MRITALLLRITAHLRITGLLLRIAAHLRIAALLRVTAHLRITALLLRITSRHTVEHRELESGCGIRLLHCTLLRIRCILCIFCVNGLDIVRCGIRCRKERVAFVDLDAADKFGLLSELLLCGCRCRDCIVKAAQEIADCFMRNRNDGGNFLAFRIGCCNDTCGICHIGLNQLLEDILGGFNDSAVCDLDRYHSGCDHCTRDRTDCLLRGIRILRFTVIITDAGRTADDAAAVNGDQGDRCIRHCGEFRKCFRYLQCELLCFAEKLLHFHLYTTPSCDNLNRQRFFSRYFSVLPDALLCAPRHGICCPPPSAGGQVPFR